MDRREFLGAAAALPLLVCGTDVAAGRAVVYAVDGVAILGADPVAYFQGRGAVAGSISERVRWRGATWLFASRENRELFERDPRRFAPRFGGYCAYRLSQGRLAPIDPRAFVLHRDRLYLMNSFEARRAWRKDLLQNISLAEQHWPALLG